VNGTKRSGGGIGGVAMTTGDPPEVPSPNVYQIDRPLAPPRRLQLVALVVVVFWAFALYALVRLV
jgi:hypothetical protein